MRYLPALIALLFFTQYSCKKDPGPTTTNKQTVDTQKVALQTEYRLLEIKTDSVLKRKFTYNEKGLVSNDTSYYYPNRPVGHYYEYDDRFRVTRSARQPFAQTNDIDLYTYNNDMMPATSYKQMYRDSLIEYIYDGKRLLEIRWYNTKGELELELTNKWTYANGTDNATSFTSTGKYSIYTENYLEYDNAHAVRLAMPGIQDLELATSVNNVVRMEHTSVTASQPSVFYETEYQYEYNEGNFPVKSVATTTQNRTFIKVSDPVYYVYEK